MQIFHNGRFHSCEETNRTFSCLVEDRGRILYTGDTLPEAYRQAIDRTNLQGRCAVPAFADTHLHFSSFALFHATLDVRRARTFAELADTIRAYENRHPEDKVILGFGVSAHTLEEQRLPGREDLDRITGRPLMLIKYDGHAAVVNSSQLNRFPKDYEKIAGFTADSGWLTQQAFYDGVNRITRSVSLTKVLKNLLGACDELARRGIGLIHTAEGVGFPLDMDVDMMRLAARGLPQTIRIFFQTLEVKKAQRRRLPRIGGCFATALDGCFGSEDAALLAPYTHRPDDRGVLFYPQERVNRFVREAHQAGLQIALHGIGDAAAEQALCAFEQALTADPRSDHRHILIHADLMSPAQIERAARLDLHLAVQPPFLAWPQEPLSYLTRILGERARQILPLRTFLDHGLTIAGGSDAPCTLPDPLLGIHAACNHPDPDQRLTPLEALKMHTAWAAELSFDERERGTLSAGKRADFTVLDGDPLATTGDRLQDIKVLDLYLQGKPYEPVTGLAALGRRML